MEWLLGSGLAVSTAGLLWLAYVAIAAVRQRAEVVIAKACAEADRDAARAQLAQRADELSHAEERIKRAEAAVAVARKEVTNARIERVTTAAPGDVGAAVDEVLARRAAEQTTAADRRPAAPNAVSGAGPGATGPVPDWSRLAE